MTKDEALKLALKALEQYAEYEGETRAANEAITAIKEALAQPEQDGKCKYCTDGCPACDARKLPQRTWVGLTDEEIEMIYAVTIKVRKKDIMPGEQKMFAKTIEHFLKERNT